MPIIIDGNAISENILSGLKSRLEVLKSKGKTVVLSAVLVGDDPASKIYVAKKAKTAQEIGMEFLKFEYPAGITKQALIEAIEKIQAENNLSGLIIQLPLPDALWKETREITQHIALNIDVDCLSHQALGAVLMGEHFFLPPTPGAIMEILKSCQVDLTGKEVCLVGRGELIGKPLAGLFLREPVTLHVCGKSTINLAEQTKTADIIITGVGKPNLITGDMVKNGAIVIDAGISFEDGKAVGDVDFEAVKEKASIITPAVGGVGPITVAKLLENTVLAAEKN